MTKRNLYYINHIKEALESIEKYTQNLDRQGFLKNKMVQDAVIRNFEIIGEATKKLSDDFKEKYGYVEWRSIAGMRDKLIHDYIGVDLWAVWAVITDRIPEFKKQINDIITIESG